ncbi:hypothetical protein [Mesorhizobium koreense]|uniref:hypothetical protein n=1 Tax=Mesorhizobium koreense TaxID=3074855 RepID=UPI00287B64E4|nr:hypothetical protein [Mesorhizobium sp. WR6]
MGELIGMAIDLQLIIAAGYLGYRISMAGTGDVDRTEDVIFKVLVFGLVGRLAAEAVRWLTFSLCPDLFTIGLPVAVLKGAVVIAAAVGIALYWRGWGSDLVSRCMKRMQVYEDDHQPSAWRSITNAKRTWDYAQVHLTDGRILEADFAQVPNDVPVNKITLNEDGVALYVTKVIRADDTELLFEKPNSVGASIISYIPRTQISQIDIRWR